MTRTRSFYTWLAFLLCIAVVGGALVWMSSTMLRLERVEAENKQLAQKAENERLALWRMESALVPLIAQENGRPGYAYRAFYTPSEVFSKFYSKVEKGDIRQPSELISLDSPYVLLHFEIGPDGEATSPQIPTGNDADLADHHKYTSVKKIEEAERRLEALQPVLSRKKLLAALSLPTLPQPQPPSQVAGNGNAAINDFPNQQQAAGPNQQQQIVQRGQAEFEKRRQAGAQAYGGLGYTQIAKTTGGKVEPMKAIWLGEHLVLARQSVVDGRQYVQGCVLNWPALRDMLRKESNDLLPEGELIPVRDAKQAPAQLMLASVPVRLKTEPLAAVTLPMFTPTRSALGISWLCFILSACAVAFLLRAALILSDRRGAFVSAVTHELRTPLTTFRLYTEMLNSGMVDEQGSREYLDTLHREADRLGHLVENVLSYARLESPKKKAVTEEFDLTQVLERMRDTLNRRANEAEMTIDMSCAAVSRPPHSRDRRSPSAYGEEETYGATTCEVGRPEHNQLVKPVRVKADAAAVERIVFNLVDNACKYARSSNDKTIHIACQPNGTHAELRVTDHGPGVPDNVAGRMFRPFRKSDREAANTAPGVGLGLSLSRRLARSMGGDLMLDKSTTNGASFMLTLPLVSTAQ